jgi:hypothetical protein
MQVMEDLLDEDQIKPFEHICGGVQVQRWRALVQDDFETRASAIEAEVKCAFAELFMQGRLTFTLVQRSRPEIVWYASQNAKVS